MYLQCRRALCDIVREKVIKLILLVEIKRKSIFILSQLHPV